MKLRPRHLALLLSGLPLFALAQPAPPVLPSVADAQLRAQTKPVTARKIILVGDSTTAVVGGWGPSFCAYHLSSFTACINLARGGRSTFNYRAEGSWAIALAEMKSGGFKDTYVLIQFGHNDQPGKPGRSTDLATEFPQNLAAYVAEVRAAGAKPVLVTPLTRRSFKNGQLDNSLEPWAEATRRVAAELKVPLVDLHARSQEAVQAMGAAESTRFAQLPPSAEVLAAAKTGSTIAAATGVAPAAAASVVATSAASTATTATAGLATLEPMGQAKLAFDYTHLGRAGADFFAKLVTLELARAVPELRNDLIP